ncbi:hypothetical protein HDV05_000509 [Chytridiales sp. JEL 0842]|nr:hypothetical protein HDV05_000509 [Chytridiales sp. JEL 0842]
MYAAAATLRQAAARRAACAVKPVRLLTPIAHGHSLTVPYEHVAVTPFANGVPTEQVRELHPVEKKWDFWTSSDAFLEVKPTLGGLSVVPFGEAWVLDNGKVLTEGTHFLLPFSKVKAVKNVHPVSFGVVSPAIQSKDGSSVNAYAVTYVKVTDPAKSALYVDPESNTFDSERAAAKVVRKVLESTIPTVSVGPNGSLPANVTADLSAKITSALKAKEAEYGLEVLSVEIRGAFPVSQNIPDKLRALDPPVFLPTAAGHNLSADYWADVLSPPFFFKRKFGNEKEVVTPATVSLEWSIPSPPDYHHFNEVPRLNAEPPSGEGQVAKAH